MDLQQVVHDAVQLPLRIDLLLASECKSIESNVAQVAENRLYRGDAPIVNGLAHQGVDLAPHSLELFQNSLPSSLSLSSIRIRSNSNSSINILNVLSLFLALQSVQTYTIFTEVDKPPRDTG